MAGWASALVLAGMGITDRLHDETANQLMLVSLSLALICSACMALWKHQRPLGAAYEMGYEAGRRDAIREASGRRRANVTPIRRDADGGSEFVSSGA